MRPVANTKNVTVEVTNDDVIEEKWLPFLTLTKKLSVLEKADKQPHKEYCKRFYNSNRCEKYNIRTVAGLKFIDVDEPMKEEVASLHISFVRR